METDNKSSILAFIIALPLILCLLVSSASGAKLYTGGEKYEKEGVIALLLHLNGKMIEWAEYFPNPSSALTGSFSPREKVFSISWRMVKKVILDKEAIRVEGQKSIFWWLQQSH